MQKDFQKPIWISNTKLRTIAIFSFFLNSFFSSKSWCSLHHRNFRPVLLLVRCSPTEFQPARV